MTLQDAPFVMIQPPAPLDAVLHCVWFAYGPDEPGARERVLPNGVIEVIIALDETAHGVVDDTVVRPYRHSFVAGMQRAGLIIEAARFTNLVGLRFRPGGLHALWRLPMHELSDTVEQLDGFDDHLLLRLRERLANAASLGARVRVVCDALLPRLVIDEQATGRVRAAVAAILGEPNIGVRTLACRLGVTHQHLLRQFRAEVGVSPRTLARIIRFNRVIRTIEPATTPPHWADLAAQAGYYDQSHLVAEFRTLAGMTPTQYWTRRLPDGNHVRETFSSSNTEDSVPA